MKSNFNTCFNRVIASEGGYVNHPKDPGGATNYGVTQRTYDAWRKSQGLPTRSVKNITMDEVKKIYKFQYWDASRCDDLPLGVDYCQFDGAINSGVSQSAKWLQRSLGVNADGAIGKQTIEAAKAYANQDGLIDKICDRRMAFLKALKTWPTFGKGWTARVSKVRSVAKAMNDPQKPMPAITNFAEGTEKAFITDANAAPTTTIADGATGVGVGSLGIGAVIETTKNTLIEYTDVEIIRNIVVVLTLVGAVITVGGIMYRLYQAKKQREYAEALGA